jgi:hypothetical protein
VLPGLPSWIIIKERENTKPVKDFWATVFDYFYMCNVQENAQVATVCDTFFLKQGKDQYKKEDNQNIGRSKTW